MRPAELFDALAGEVEALRSRLSVQLQILATSDAEGEAFTEALLTYSEDVQRMGEASEAAGLPGLQLVCEHVLQNVLAMQEASPEERPPFVAFLDSWPPLVSFYLHNSKEPSAAAGLIDRLVTAPLPLDEITSRKLMYILGAMPLQMEGDDDDSPRVARQAAASDVELVVPQDVDARTFEGFMHEAPDQARQLLRLVGNLARGEGDSSDIIAAKRVAHTLKGSGSIIGLRGIASVAHEFEELLERYERTGESVGRATSEVLLEAAHCLDQMVSFVLGTDEFPADAVNTLQRLMDLSSGVTHEEGAPQRPVATASAAAVSQQRPTPASQPQSALGVRVDVRRVDELFRLSGEVTVHASAMEARLKAVMQRSRDLLEQNLRVQKRLFELETAVDVRGLAMLRSRSRRTEEAADFDPLEMDQYSELHGTAHALIEETADSRNLAQRLQEELAELSAVQARQRRLAKDLQHIVGGTRMTEVSSLEPRLQRNVRSTCKATGKDVQLFLQGGDTLVDSDVLSRLAEPLLHILRNAVDHGIESPQRREELGKNRVGRIELRVWRHGQQVVMRCEDDGAGLDLASIRARAQERGLVPDANAVTDEEAARLVLLPGFSTRDEVSEISGRGVGLDVVRDWVTAFNGSIAITSRPGQGCAVELRFAATLSTVHSLIVEVCGQRFSIPSVQVEQAVPKGIGEFVQEAGQWVYRHGTRRLPVHRLGQLAGLFARDDLPLDECEVVVFRHSTELVGLVVDRLLDSRELLVKSPGRYAGCVGGVVGLSILGDGGLSVSLDVGQLMSRGQLGASTQAALPSKINTRAESSVPSVLVVDDAITVRAALLRLIEDAGYRAQAARDGVEAVQALANFRPDIVLTDLEMPNMNGVELTAHIRGRQDLRDLPVFMITSRSQEKHRAMARSAGVSSYFTKPYNDAELLDAIESALQRT